MRNPALPLSHPDPQLGRHRGTSRAQWTPVVSAPGGEHRRQSPHWMRRRRAMVATALTAALVAAPGVTSAAAAHSYTVRSGDTLSSIAQRHGTTWRTLYRLNRNAVSSADRIFVGQRLRVGGKGSGPDLQSADDGLSGPFVQRVLAEARKVEGVPYVYGGSTPSQGFDCSGFTSYVFARAGKTIPRTSAAQAAAARRISSAELRPGDLVFYTPSGGVSHVAIYAGRGMVWEAPSSGRQVRYAPMWNVPRFYGRL